MTFNLSLKRESYMANKIMQNYYRGERRTFANKWYRRALEREREKIKSRGGKACRSCIIESKEKKASKFSYFVLLDWLLDRYRRMNNFHRFSIIFILAPWFFFVCCCWWTRKRVEIVGEFQGESILCVTLTRLCINYMPFHHVSVLWVKWHEVVSEQIEHAWRREKYFAQTPFRHQQQQQH